MCDEKLLMIENDKKIIVSGINKVLDIVSITIEINETEVEKTAPENEDAEATHRPSIIGIEDDENTFVDSTELFIMSIHFSIALNEIDIVIIENVQQIVRFKTLFSFSNLFTIEKAIRIVFIDIIRLNALLKSFISALQILFKIFFTSTSLITSC